RRPAGGPTGLTAGSVAPVSRLPPLVLVSIDQANDMHPALRAAQRFVFNVLAADQEALSRRFAAEHPDRFDGVPYRDSKHGLPIIEGAVVSVECERRAEAPRGDHPVFFGRVTGGRASVR